MSQVTSSGTGKYYLDLFDGRLAWREHDGHDEEIYYYDGTSVERLTSNNENDSYPLVVNTGVVWYQDYGALYYFDGTATQYLANGGWNPSSKFRYIGNMLFQGYGGIYLAEF